jgi:predicted lipoprotein with Yx(FWY)xxD motif
MKLRTLGALVGATTLTLLAACGYGDDDGQAAAPEGPAAEAPAPGAAGTTSARLADSPLGQILVDGSGNTLYGFTNDADGVSTCTGDCAATWPAHLIDGAPAPSAPLDPALFTVVDGAEGGQQLKAGKWPLYRFAGDSGPGDINGQGSGGVWFVVGADGSLITDAAAGPSAEGADGSDGPDETNNADETNRADETDNADETNNADDAGSGEYGY